VVGHLVQVEGERALVIKELGIHGPLVILVPEVIAQELGAQVGDDLGEEDLLGVALVAIDHVTEALVGRGEGAVVGLGGGAEPAFIDAAPLRAEGVEVVGMELEALAGDAERAGHPGGCQPQDAFALFKCGVGHSSVFLSLCRAGC